MKKNLTLIAVMLMMVSVPAFSQFTFTVAPGLNLNSAYFGYKAGKVVPFIGLQFAGASIKSVETGTEWDNGEGEAVNFSDEVKVKGSILMPTIGVKFFAVEKNKIKGYVIGAFSKPFLSAKMTYNGEANEYIDEVLDRIKLWGVTTGVGVEYFFDDNFSVGGEFGLQIVGGKYSYEYTDTYYNADLGTDVEADFKDEISAKLMPTYSKIGLNFYF